MWGVHGDDMTTGTDVLNAAAPVIMIALRKGQPAAESVVLICLSGFAAVLAVTILVVRALRGRRR